MWALKNLNHSKTGLIKIEIFLRRKVNYSDRTEYYLKFSTALLLKEGKKCVRWKLFEEKQGKKGKIETTHVAGAIILARTIETNR